MGRINRRNQQRWVQQRAARQRNCPRRRNALGDGPASSMGVGEAAALLVPFGFFAAIIYLSTRSSR